MPQIQEVGPETRWLRLVAVALFAVAVVMTVLTRVLSSGLQDQPGVANAEQLGQAGVVLFALTTGSAGLLVAWYRPRHPVAWLLLLAATLESLCDLGQAYGTRALVLDRSLPAGRWALSLSAPLWIVGIVLMTATMLLRYPDGTIAGRWARRVDRLVLFGIAVLWVVYAGSDNSVTDAVPAERPPIRLDPPVAVVAAVGGVLAVLLVGGFAFAVGDAVRRTLRAGAPQRQQLALAVTSVMLAIAGLLLPWQPANLVLAQAVPAGVAVGVLRYRLSGIDVVVRRTLLYGALTAATLTVFVTVTWAVTTILPSATGTTLVAAVVIAVVVVPLRDRLQDAVDRFVYGQRHEAWRSLGDIAGSPLDATTAERVVQALAEALRLPDVQLWSGSGQSGTDDLLCATSAGRDAAVMDGAVLDRPRTRVPLVVEGTPLAVLLVAPRHGERHLPRADERLLAALSPLLGLLLRSVELTDLLRAERTRTASSTAVERERLRRELHDRLGPSLTGIGLGLEAVASTQLPQRAADVVARLRPEVAACLEEVRRILDDLRPELPDDEDVVALVKARAIRFTETSGTTVSIDTPRTVPPLPQEVRIAVVRIVDEALTNVVRHARARTCRVSLAVEDGAASSADVQPDPAGPDGGSKTPQVTRALVIQVEDDGVGFNGLREGGLGVPSMRTRAFVLGGTLYLGPREGGGTVLAVRIPVPATAAAAPLLSGTAL